MKKFIPVMGEKKGGVNYVVPKGKNAGQQKSVVNTSRQESKI